MSGFLVILIAPTILLWESVSLTTSLSKSSQLILDDVSKECNALVSDE
ncbi:hypothetical protein BvCmsSIP065_03569 [Escherichia coli]|nr:hypothetical protein BvCmsHHP054_02407 [Escherichia coli]GDI99254.1 hypothetical protein BvCmsKKP029_04636 [Escherichia coli]GDU01656.1 hypothetical protein BvCmsOUP024_04349 [Escherichia coli]GDV45573.1 hypothetical protein BvCmsSIP065_03569 [Escherichia coli]GDW53206.1 hypothetical protein BvCmsSIP068_04217 [Escherichia coli]